MRIIPHLPHGKSTRHLFFIPVSQAAEHGGTCQGHAASVAGGKFKSHSPVHHVNTVSRDKKDQQNFTFGDLSADESTSMKMS